VDRARLWLSRPERKDPPHDRGRRRPRLYRNRSGILADPISGTAVLEVGATEILPPVGAFSKDPVRLSRPRRQADRPQPRGKAQVLGLRKRRGRETDCPLERGGFELTVPRQGEVTAVLALIDVRRGMWHGVRCRG
jgi:hypothetical protein